MKFHFWANLFVSTGKFFSARAVQKAPLHQAEDIVAYGGDHNDSKSSDHFAALWGGFDIMDDESQGKSFALTSIGRTQQGYTLTKGHALKRLKVMGYMNTGTNLALSLLMANLQLFGVQEHWLSCDRFHERFPELLPKDVAEFVPQADQGRASICSDTWSGSGIPKHAPPYGKYFDQLVADPDTVIVALMRNPFSWLLSLRERPYVVENRICVESQAYGGPNSTCNLKLSAEEGFPEKRFSSLAGWWNFMALQWLTSATIGKATILLTSYEELVLQPKVVMARVFDALGYGHDFDPNEAEIVHDPQGPGNNIPGYKAENSLDEAVSKIQDQTFLNQPGTMPEQVAALCAELDEHLLSIFKLSYACTGGPPDDEINEM